MSDAFSIKVRVAKKKVEAQDICTFELVEAGGSMLPAFPAGSHIDVRLPGGMTRQYSLCNSASDGSHYLIGVLRDPATRGGSAALHDTVEEGDLLSITAPKSHFALAHDAKQSLLLAGGIGITPILCMAERLSAIGKPFELHYCTRSIERTAFLQRIRTSELACHTTFHLDNGPKDQNIDLDALLASPRDGVHVYVCGPRAFIDVVLRKAREVGWPDEQLHHEFFGAAPAASANDEVFEVQLASTGRVVQVLASQTIVEALDSAGVMLETSCAQGVCGTCITKVLEGEPDHRDLYLTPEEQAMNNQILPCCSRAKSRRLVLDL